jgi:primary-amine oxidase
MCTESVNITPAAFPTKQTASHPLAPLAALEITTAATLVKRRWPAHTDLHFKVITLEEPPKAEVITYLEAEHCGRPLPRISRKAFVNYYIRNTVCFSVTFLAEILKLISYGN